MKEKPRKRPSSTNLSHERGDGFHLGFGVTHQLLRLHSDTVRGRPELDGEPRAKGDCRLLALDYPVLQVRAGQRATSEVLKLN